MQNANDLNAVFTNPINNDEWEPSDHQLASIGQSAGAPALRKSRNSSNIIAEHAGDAFSGCPIVLAYVVDDPP